MNAEEFVKNFLFEKENILKSYFDNNNYRNDVSEKISDLNLSKENQLKLKEIISSVLKDSFYSILLGLDGSASIGETQQIFKIYDENDNLISDSGGLEEFAYKYFHQDSNK